MKRFLCILLLLALCLSLCACGGKNTYGIKVIETLSEQEYALAFRNDDSTYYYVVAALEELAADGYVDELAMKWFGSRCVDINKNAGAVSKLGELPERTLIIGIDENSFPAAYISEGGYWGYDIQLAMAVCEKLGWTLQIQPIYKENIYIELSSGNIDVAWGGVAINREEIAAGKYTIYGPYLTNNIVVAARDKSGVWNKLKLNGANMAMSATQEAMDALQSDAKLAKRLGQITRLAGGTPECFEYLYAGKCDAVLTDSTAIDYYNSH